MIKACIFDLGGTIVDRYSLTPFIAFKGAFENKNINLCSSLIRQGGCLNKMDYINKICDNITIRAQWYNNYKREITPEDKNEIFRDFSKIQAKQTIERMKIIPQTKKCVQYLKDNNILTGVTTPFDYEQTMRVKSILEVNNVHLDNYVSSSCSDLPGRPEPYMIHENMNKLNLDDPKRIIKIGDTFSGIQEGLNAGCLTIGVSRWSVYMAIDSYEEMMRLDNVIMNGSNNYSLNYHNQQEKIKKSGEILKGSGAHYVIDTLEELPGIIEHINRMDEPNPYKL